MVEGARLESEYTSKAYRGFESLPLRHLPIQTRSPMTAQSRGFLRIIWPLQIVAVRLRSPAIALLCGEQCGEISECGEGHPKHMENQHGKADSQRS